MADFDNTNRGSIWKNTKKETEKHPDFTGEINVNGTMYWVSAWKRKEGASDKAPALSFQIKPKEAQEQKKPSRDDFKEAAKKEFDNDLPF